MNKLVGKIFIKGKIVTQTGLHIGGSKSALDIGGIDLNVIKTPKGIPFIPGSSLKGKLRTMLARLEGSEDFDKDSPKIKQIFGDSGDNDKKNGKATRILVRDAVLDHVKFKKDFEGTELDASDYTESKWENTINRRTGTAEHPRQLERVPSGAEFDFEIVYDRFADKTGAETDTSSDLTLLRTAMRLLEGDYIGGSGSRGYGKIRFENVTYTTSEIKENNGVYTLDAEKNYEFTF